MEVRDKIYFNNNLNFFYYFIFIFFIFCLKKKIPTSPSYTYQCVNGHIVCEKCRWKILRCPTCRVQLGRGRCLIADKILRYLQHNSMIKIGGGDGSTGKNMSTKIDDKLCRRASAMAKTTERNGNEMENGTSKSTTADENNLNAKNSCLPFKFTFRSVASLWRSS